MQAYHFVNKTTSFQKPLLDRNACVDLWDRLRKRFPKVLACVLMPDHVHLIIETSETSNPAKVKWDFSVELRAWTQRFHPGKSIWAAVPEPEFIADRLKLQRQIRYVHLNPCREGLVKDPLLWEWSTHRDVTGCVIDPWSNLQTLMKCFSVSSASKERLGEVMHRYISGDPSAAVAGTPMIREYREGMLISSGCAQVLRACSIARREEFGLLKRSRARELAVHTVRRLKLQPNPDALKMSLRNWQMVSKKFAKASDIQVVLKLLSDPRCR